MCKGACEGSCSTEIALGCPVLKTVERFVPVVEETGEAIWREFQRIMELEDRARRGETGWQLMQQAA